MLFDLCSDSIYLVTKWILYFYFWVGVIVWGFARNEILSVFVLLFFKLFYVDNINWMVIVVPRVELFWIRT